MACVGGSYAQHLLGIRVNRLSQIVITVEISSSKIGALSNKIVASE